MKLKKNIAVSESGYIFNPQTGESFSVNSMGIEILKQLSENRTETEINSHICKHYNIDPDSFSKDLKEFFETLRHYLLVENE